MKLTDFAPRVSAFLSYVEGRNLTGVEVGCNVGAHAEALLTWCSIDKIILVDTFENVNTYWYLMGRLETKTFARGRFEIIKATSNDAAQRMGSRQFDFIYIDITHDYETVKQSLIDWWPHLKKGGILGYRNYSESNPDLLKAVSEFIKATVTGQVKIDNYHNEIIIWK